MTTSRSQVERVISPEPETVTVATLAKAARAAGYDLDIRLTAARGSRRRTERTVVQS
jgi:hypothetical protein